MELVAQVTDPSLLKEATASSCNKIRFGSEFCMYALPPLNRLKTAYEDTTSSGREFIYVTPRLADAAMDKVREHLALLNDLGGAVVVANDLGTIRVLRELPRLKLYLGRQLVYTPSRSPWKEITEQMVNIFAKRNVKRIFYQTALNYEPTIEFFKGLGAIGADIDWIPECFNDLGFLTRNKLQVSVHLQLVPAAITRKCHMARFLGVEDLESCPRPCYSKAYSMENDLLKTETYLHGNAVFRRMEPNRKTAKELVKHGVNDLVVSMNPLTGITSREQLDDVARSLLA